MGVTKRYLCNPINCFATNKKKIFEYYDNIFDIFYSSLDENGLGFIIIMNCDLFVVLSKNIMVKTISDCWCVQNNMLCDSVRQR